MINFTKKYWKSLLVTIAILVVSFINPPELPEVQGFSFGVDKIVHVIMYLALASAMLLEHFVIYGKTRTRRYWLLCGGFPLFVAVLTEICQETFFPTRSFDWDDIIANIIGIVIAFLFSKVIFKISKTKSWLTKI